MNIKFITDLSSTARGFIFKALALYGFFKVDENTLDDLSQDLILRVLSSGIKLDDAKVFGYIKTIAKRTVVDWKASSKIVNMPRRTYDYGTKKQKIKVVSLQSNMFVRQKPSGDIDEKVPLLINAIEKLNPHYRDIIKSVYGIDAPIVSISQLAKDYKLARGTLRFKLNKALAHIKNCMTNVKLCAECQTPLADNHLKFCSRKCKKRNYRKRKLT